MKLIGRILFLPVFVLFFINANGQTNTGDAVPVDPEIRYGKLPNGLSYYIRHNKEPEDRASYYIIQNVGALLENDNQNGLAHFLEHMAFNGTKHFPGKGIISSLEKHGVAFGYNINAYTAFNETVYNLSDVPVDHPGLSDTCLLILNDWSNYLLLTEEEIDAERGVISEEWRTRRTASFRMRQQFFPVLLKGSKFTSRDVIGDLDIINNFDYKTLRDFYHDWYRTDLQAIVIVGDVDVDETEQKVIDQFSKIPAVEKPEERPFFDVPEHDETLYVHVTDKEASQNSIDVYTKIKSLDKEEKGLSYMREKYVRNLFNSMMSVRLNELLQKGIPPFINGTIRYGGFVRGYDVFSISATSKKGEDNLAFRAIYTEAERIKRHGFTAGELKRAKSKMLSNWDNYYKEKDKINNDSWARKIQQHYLINEPVPSVDYEYGIVKAVIPEITLAEVSEKAKIWMTDKNRVIIVQGPEEENAEYLTQEQADIIIKEVESSEIEAYADTESGESLISEMPAAGSIVSTKELEDFDAVEWTLSNGVKVIYRNADYEKDNVVVSAFSFGGVSQVEDDFIPEASIFPALVGTYGVGDFDNITLQKMLSGKKASLSVSLSEVTDNIRGSSTPADFEIMMQLLYLKFERPRFDEEAHDAIIARYKAFMTSMNNNPQKVMQDSLSLILTNYHPRTRIMDNDFLEDVEFEYIKSIYKERFRDADDFTFFIIGNVEEELAKEMAVKYIGSLTSYPASETWIDRGVRHPKGKTKKIIEIPLTVPKSTVIQSMSAEMEFNPYNKLAIRVLNGILNLVYTEKIREEEGGTYGVSTRLSLQQFPVELASAVILFDCDPERAESLKSIVYSEIDRIVNSGPTQENLDKTVLNILKNREESKQHNSYWLSALYTYYMSNINNNDPANYEDILNSFTIDDIKETAKELFLNTDMVDLIFTPQED